VDDPARVALRVVSSSLILAMFGCARIAPQLIAPAATRGRDVSIAAPSTEAASSLADEPLDRDEDPDVDLYGNDITAAVAKYKLDSDGSLYELHSPQTQLPRLGSPRS